MKRVHGNWPILHCTESNFKTKYSYYLEQHNKVHTEGKLKCELCEFETATGKYTMDKHVKNKHLGEGLHFCSSCNYSTGSKHRLERHEERHSTDVTFTCDQCTYKTHVSIDLKKHVKSHGAPTYICDNCDYKTWDSGNFSTHKQVKHGSVQHKCDDCDYENKSRRSLRLHKLKYHS